MYTHRYMGTCVHMGTCIHMNTYTHKREEIGEALVQLSSITT